MEKMDTGWECFKIDSVDLGSGKMVPLLSLTCCQQRVSYQAARSVDTSKITLLSQMSALNGNILSVRRRRLDPASERYNSKLPLLHMCLKEAREQMEEEIDVRLMKANLLYVYTWQYPVMLCRFQLTVSIVPRRKLI